MRSLIVLCLALAASPAAWGADTVDLEEALTEVERSNPTLAGALANLRAAAVAPRRAWAAYLPSVTASGVYTRNSVVAELAFPDFTAGFQMIDGPDGPTMVPVAIESIDVQKENQLGAQLQIQQGILVPTAFSQIGAAKAGVRAAEQGTEQLRRELLFGTAELYYAIVALAEAVRVTEAHVALFEDHLRVAEIAYEAGSVPEISVLRARIDLRNAERDLVRARRDLETSVGQLATLMGRDDADLTIVPPRDLQEVLEGGETGAGAVPALGEALAARSDYKARVAQLEAARKTHGAALASFLPTVGAGFNYNWSNTTGFTGEKDSWAAMVSVNVPIFDRGLRAADVTETKARVREAEAAIEEIELQVQQDLREAEVALEAARTSLVAAREQADLARRSWTAVETSFAAGASSSIEVADAATNLRAAELSVISEAVGYVSARLQLQQAAGAAHPLDERVQ